MKEEGGGAFSFVAWGTEAWKRRRPGKSEGGKEGWMANAPLLHGEAALSRENCVQLSSLIVRRERETVNHAHSF
jgi:hypothetical protein